jgi:chromosome segregation ATPase
MLVYGSHCPVCDNFVTVKKELPQKSTKDLDAQIDALKAEIEKCRAALFDVLAVIGQWEAAEKVSRQYAASLSATLKSKKRAIQEILKEYNATDVPALFAMVKEAAERSNALTLAIDKWNKDEAERLRLAERDSLLATRLTAIEKLMAEETERCTRLSKELTQKTNEYTACAAVLDGQNADVLLEETLILDKEYGDAAEEIMNAAARLQTAQSKKDELTRAVLPLILREPIAELGQDCNYAQTVVKVIMTDMSNLVREIEKAQEDREIAKLRLSAVHKMMVKTTQEKEKIDEETLSLQTRVEESEKRLAMLEEQYGERFNALGIRTEKDLEKLVLDEPTEIQYRTEVIQYDEDCVRIQQTITDLSKMLDELKPYNDSLPELTAHLDEVMEAMKNALAACAQVEDGLQENGERYLLICQTNQELTDVQARIKDLEELTAVLDGEQIDVKRMTDYIMSIAARKIKHWSKEQYYMEGRNGTATLFIAAKEKAIAPAKFTAGERILLHTGLALACKETLLKFMGADVTGALTVSKEGCHKDTLPLFIDACRENDFLLIPMDENEFYQTASRL